MQKPARVGSKKDDKPDPTVIIALCRGESLIKCSFLNPPDSSSSLLSLLESLSSSCSYRPSSWVLLPVATILQRVVEILKCRNLWYGNTCKPDEISFS